jgi:hypothetical protein
MATLKLRFVAMATTTEVGGGLKRANSAIISLWEIVNGGKGAISNMVIQTRKSQIL